MSKEKGSHHHQLTYVGLMHCGACGRGVTGEEHWNRHGTRYVYYRCTRRIVGNVVCREPFISERDVEAQLAEVLARLAIPDQLLAYAWAKLNEEAIHRGESSAARREGLRKELAAAEAELDRLTRLCTRAFLSEDEYLRSRMRLLDELGSLRKRIENPNRAEQESDDALREILTLASMAAKTFAEGTHQEKREILGRICEDIKLMDRKLTVTLRRPYQVIAESLPEVLSHLGESNPLETTQFFRKSIEIPPLHTPISTRCTTRGKYRKSNPQNVAQHKQETAGLEPAISSWSG